MKQAFFFFGCFLGLVLSLQAQQTKTPPALGSVFLGLTFTQPTGSFKETYPGMLGLGGSFGFTVRPRAGYSPVEVGTQVSYLPYGIEKYTVGTGSSAYQLKTTHSFIPWHALVRLKPRRTATLNPYLDGLAGIAIFNTRTKEKEDVVAALRDEDAIVVNKHNTTLFSYGLAAGLAFGGGSSKSFFGDIRLVYLENPLTWYVKKGNVQVDSNGFVDYKFSRSETSMFLLQLNLLGVLTRLP